MNTKAQPPAKPAIKEFACDWTWANYYVKLGFTKNQVRMLGEFGRKFGFKKMPCAEAARWIVLAGLMNLDAVEKQIHKLARKLHEHSFAGLNQKINAASAAATGPPQFRIQTLDEDTVIALKRALGRDFVHCLMTRRSDDCHVFNVNTVLTLAPGASKATVRKAARKLPHNSNTRIRVVG